MVELSGGKKLSPSRRSDVPFPAVVGQHRLKRALTALAVNDELDGLLVRGEKGTAKSTTARALVDLLPEQRAVADCPYGCPPDAPDRQCEECQSRENPSVEQRPVPFVTLPLGASRDRVVGSLSVTDALAGTAEFNPGLLARANRGFLYVDEVNLLDDHLVDVLLDAAASGVNRVERDGVSVTHPAEFTLIGTMNPEEGDLRPQFRDRFALQAEVAGTADLDDRLEIVRRALDGFDGDHAAETDRIRDRVSDARALLDDVTLPDSLGRDVAELCRDAGVEGHRADIATARAARTLAALDGRPTVAESDVRRAAALALPHRLKTRPFEDEPDADELLDDHFDDDRQNEDHGGNENSDEAEESPGDSPEGETESSEAGPEADSAGRDSQERNGEEENCEERDDEHRGGPPGDGEDGSGEAPEPPGSDGGAASSSTAEKGDGGADESGGGGDDEEAAPLVPGQSVADSADPAFGRAPELDVTADRAGGGGRADAGPTAGGRGVQVRTERADSGGDVDAAASVRAAALRGSDRVESRDLRRSVRSGADAALVVFAVDASASMRGPLRAAKGVALDLLQDAYERRDVVSVVTFAGTDADVVLPPTDDVDHAARHLKSLPTGDRTPLPAGLRAASDVLSRADPSASVVVVVTDGRANAGSDQPTADTRAAARALADHGAHVLVVDPGTGGRSSLVEDVVAAADGERIPLDALTPDRVADAVRETTGGGA
ncbi:VWA domain-containing protein [Halobaculum sp. P14]|uniref:VWA domain-containing protein n=1 Tax=Halobaculum sp. P14 TaxID=3421638 RepID=UPI003EC0D864